MGKKKETRKAPQTPKPDAVTIQANPQSLIELAIEKDADVEKLEKLMNLQERWSAQQAKKSFLMAMSIFQSECPVLNKSKTVEFKQTKYKYTPLGDIISQIKNILKQAGLSYRWESKESGDNIEVTCVVSHLDGHSESTTMSGKLDATGSKNIIQQRGSTTTYLRRYTLTSALGIATADEDADGQQPEEKNKDNPNNLPELTPKDDKKWTGAIKALVDKTTTIKKIKNKYYLTPENEASLKEGE